MPKYINRVIRRDIDKGYWYEFDAKNDADAARRVMEDSKDVHPAYISNKLHRLGDEVPIK